MKNLNVKINANFDGLSEIDTFVSFWPNVWLFEHLHFFLEKIIGGFDQVNFSFCHLSERLLSMFLRYNDKYDDIFGRFDLMVP